MDNLILLALSRISTLCVKVSLESEEVNAFYDFAGHVKFSTVQIHKKGVCYAEMCQDEIGGRDHILYVSRPIYVDGRFSHEEAGKVIEKLESYLKGEEK